jgi:hypothetical protein
LSSAEAAHRGICVHRTDFFDPEVQTRANVEPGQKSNLLGRHPFGLSFYPVVPGQETEHYRAKPPAFAAIHARNRYDLTYHLPNMMPGGAA